MIRMIEGSRLSAADRGGAAGTGGGDDADVAGPEGAAAES